MQNKKRKYLVLVGICFGIFIVSIPVYFAFSPDIHNYFNRVKFDRQQWINWKETEATASLRWDMTHDLLEQYKLVGMSTKEIIDLLGKPGTNSKTQMRYFLGMSGHGIDTGSLILEIENDKVTAFRILHG